MIFFFLNRKAQLDGRKKHFAALKIQTVYRGWIARKNIEKLHKAALIIQLNFKKYQARKFLFILIQDILQNQLLLMYDIHATVIQKAYRGYISRKKYFDYYKFKSWLKFIGKYFYYNFQYI